MTKEKLKLVDKLIRKSNRIYNMTKGKSAYVIVRNPAMKKAIEAELKRRKKKGRRRAR